MYVDKWPTIITQPDGTSIRCFMSGDIYFNFLHDSHMNKIKQFKDDGWYYYAIADYEQQKIVCSKVVVTPTELPHAIPEYQPNEFPARLQARKDFLDSQNIIS